MQNSLHPKKESINLYRVCYKIKANGEIHRPIGFHNFEVAQSIVTDFNARFAEDCEYFLERVNLKGLSEDELIRLIRQEKLSLDAALPYLPVNSPDVERWKSRNEALNH